MKYEVTVLCAETSTKTIQARRICLLEKVPMALNLAVGSPSDVPLLATTILFNPNPIPNRIHVLLTASEP